MREWPRIRPRKSRGDFEIDCGLVHGKRRVFVRKTWQEADELAKSLRKDRQRLGVLAARLTPEQTIQAAQAFDMLNGRPLVPAVEYYLKNNSVLVEQRTMKEAVGAYCESQEKRNCRDRTVSSTRAKLMRFISPFGPDGGSVAVFDRELIQGWLDNEHMTPGTAAGYIRVLNALFMFCIRRGWRSDNPVAGIDKPIVERPANRIMGYGEAEALMRAAQGINDAAFVRRLSILLFAGLRPSEAAQLDAADINGTIHVRPEVSKVRQERYVPISDNLAKWLAAYPATERCRNFDDKRRRVAKAWSPDVTRKTFASMHYAAYENGAQTAAIMGHCRGLDVFYRFYRVPVEKQEAEKYWGIVP